MQISVNEAKLKANDDGKWTKLTSKNARKKMKMVVRLEANKVVHKTIGEVFASFMRKNATMRA